MNEQQRQALIFLAQQMVQRQMAQQNRTPMPPQQAYPAMPNQPPLGAMPAMPRQMPPQMQRPMPQRPMPIPNDPYPGPTNPGPYISDGVFRGPFNQPFSPHPLPNPPIRNGKPPRVTLLSDKSTQKSKTQSPKSKRSKK